MVKKVIDIFKKILIYKAKQFMMTKNLRKGLNILEDDASGVQVGDIEPMNV